MSKQVVETSYQDQISIEELDDKSTIAQKLPEIIKLIELSYKDGYYGSLDINHLKKSLSKVKIVYAENQTDIAACSIYRGIGSSHKMSAIACDQTEFGKKALQEILKSDFETFSNWTWMEVSGPIEHYAKKYGGYPLPNRLAAEVLQKQDMSVDSISSDGYHYKRPIGIGDEISVFEKVIYGFKNEDIAHQVTSDVNYASSRQSFNLRESDMGQTVKDLASAVSFIELVDSCYDENGLRELTSEMATDLRNAIEILKKNPDSVSYGRHYLELAEYLQSVMPELKMFKIKF